MKTSYIYITLITLLAMAQLPGVAQDWNIQTIDPSADIHETNIQLDNNGYPHVVYQVLVSTSLNLYYASWNGIAWEIESALNTKVGNAHFCLDQNNNPHIISTYTTNGQINAIDIDNIWKPHAGESGYKSGDFNMNGQVANPDKDDLWIINEGKGSQVPE